MTIQIFPNSIKKLGFIFFVTAFIINVSFNISDLTTLPGINPKELGNSSIEGGGLMGLLNAFTGGVFGNSLGLLQIISMLGIIIYIMSKEKIEDDYINKLRLESFQLTTVIALILAIVFYIISRNPLLTLNNIIFPFIWCYIIVFFIKKRFYL